MQQLQPTSILKKYISECVVQETSAEIREFTTRLLNSHPFTCTQGCWISGGKESKYFFLMEGVKVVALNPRTSQGYGLRKRHCGFDNFGSGTAPGSVVLAVMICKNKQAARQKAEWLIDIHTISMEELLWKNPKRPKCLSATFFPLSVDLHAFPNWRGQTYFNN